MGKYLDVKIGKQIKLYRLTMGNKQDGSRWALFSFTPYEKDDKGNVFYGQEYTIFINNINQINRQLKDGDKVEISYIHSVSAGVNTYKDSKGQQQSKKVIKLVVDIKNDTSNNVNPQNQGGNQYQNYNNSQYDNTPPVFDGDGYNMPSF